MAAYSGVPFLMGGFTPIDLAISFTQADHSWRGADAVRGFLAGDLLSRAGGSSDWIWVLLLDLVRDFLSDFSSGCTGGCSGQTLAMVQVRFSLGEITSAFTFLVRLSTLRSVGIGFSLNVPDPRGEVGGELLGV